MIDQKPKQRRSISLVKSTRISTTIFCILAMLLNFGGLVVFARGFLLAEREQSIMSLGSAISKMSTRSISLGDYIGLEEVLQGTTLPDFVCQIKILNRDNALIASVASSHRTCSEDAGTIKSRNFAIATTSTIDSSASLGLVQLEIDNNDIQRKIMRLAAAVCAAAIALISLVVFLVNKSILRAFQPLSSAVNKSVTADTLSSSLIDGSPIEIRPLMERIDQLYRQQAKRQEDTRIAEIATQVAHDIRSPLSALKVAESHLSNAPEELRSAIRLSVKRIHDIAADLISIHQKGRTSGSRESSSVEQTSIVSAIEEIVQEKQLSVGPDSRIEFRLKISPSTQNLQTPLPAVELKRILSNLINNSVDALESQGTIQVTTSLTGQYFVVAVDDNGHGIPPGILAKLGERGMSHNKADGSGLGLFHAKSILAKFGGYLEIESTIGKGTTVRLHLKLSDRIR